MNENNEIAEIAEIAGNKQKSKRGRKPKVISEENSGESSKEKKGPKKAKTKEKIKKKRGRKKKCEILNGEKISGFISENFPTLDINENNKITFNNDDDYDHDDSKEIENNNEGNNFFFISKVEKKSKPLDIFKESSKKKCNIDLSKISEEEKKVFDNDLDVEVEKEIKPKTDITSNKKNKSKVNSKFKSKISKEETIKNKEKLKIKNIILHVRDGNVKEWNKKTNLLCWWCCHPFNTMPCFFPTHYNEYSKRFKIQGNFCSWNCAKAYKLEDSKGTRGQDMYLFTLLLMHLGIKNYRDVKSAPAKEVLKAFGGNLTIEEFREISINREKVKLLSNPMQIELDHAFRISY